MQKRCCLYPNFYTPLCGTGLKRTDFPVVDPYFFFIGVPGLKWCDLEQCVKWMVPFAMSIREVGSSALRTFKGIAADDMHNIQTHVAYLEWLVSFSFCCFKICCAPICKLSLHPKP